MLDLILRIFDKDKDPCTFKCHQIYICSNDIPAKEAHRGDDYIYFPSHLTNN